MNEKLIPKYRIGNIFKMAFSSGYRNDVAAANKARDTYVSDNLLSYMKNNNLTDEKFATKQLKSLWEHDYKNWDKLKSYVTSTLKIGDEEVKTNHYLNRREKLDRFNRLYKAIGSNTSEENPTSSPTSSWTGGLNGGYFSNINSSLYQKAMSQSSPLVKPSIHLSLINSSDSTSTPYTRKYNFNYDSVRNWYSSGSRLSNFNKIMNLNFTNVNELTDEWIDKFADWLKSRNGLLIVDGKAGNNSMAVNNGTFVSRKGKSGSNLRNITYGLSYYDPNTHRIYRKAGTKLQVSTGNGNFEDYTGNNGQYVTKNTDGSYTYNQSSPITNELAKNGLITQTQSRYDRSDRSAKAIYSRLISGDSEESRGWKLLPGTTNNYINDKYKVIYGKSPYLGNVNGYKFVYIND